MKQREVRRALSALEAAAASHHYEYNCGDRVTARREAKIVRDALIARERLRKVLRDVMESGSVLFLCDGRIVNELIDLTGARNIERSDEDDTSEASPKRDAAAQPNSNGNENGAAVGAVEGS